MALAAAHRSHPDRQLAAALNAMLSWSFELCPWARLRLTPLTAYVGFVSSTLALEATEIILEPEVIESALDPMRGSRTVDLPSACDQIAV